MISEGRGMQADSIAISRTTPEYPNAEIVATMKLDSIPIIFATIILEEVQSWVHG